MTRVEALSILNDYFSEGLVITIAEALISAEREECAKLCDESDYPDGIDLAHLIRARGQA